MLPERLVAPTSPRAPEASMVTGDHFRITVLTSRLVRLEYSPDGDVEDRATQLVLNRDFPTPEFEVDDGPDLLQIRTEHFHLRYDRGPFSASGLSLQVGGNTSNYHSVWRWDTPPDTWAGRPSNYGGTARTLDGADGAVELAPGLMSRYGYAEVLDAGLALDENGWVAPRPPGHLDVYVFAHGHDYRGALRDFYALTGPQPLLPRYALGNWWSRYFRYSEASYRALFERFAAEDLPFSVAVLDMDWHLVDEVDPRFGSGWTGYTWNRELFPDPPGLCDWLHERGVRVTLNLHPADGVRAFEDGYADLATAMGIDPATERPVAFDAADPEFLVHYLEQILHPLEERGVDFWWVDWQSGPTSRLPGLDPLWMLNHVHFLDAAWRGRRPLTFSRYAGLGSHRYPVGFSGDTIMTWDSLAFQPYFTATAANVGYGWWSHDVGGHVGGERDEELQARWFQFGVFSPINRLHTTIGAFYGREPWRYSPRVAAVMGDCLRLRHRLVPYLYTMNYRAHREGEPLVQPLYYDDPRRPEAQASAGAYTFGTALLVAPITRPGHPRLGLGQVSSWLPEGRWFDLFTGLGYDGGRTQVFYRPLEQIPVLAREGSILPLTAEGEYGIENPARLELRVFGARDGEFELYEDDDAAAPRAVTTRFVYRPAERRFAIEPARGELAVTPARRDYVLRFEGIEEVGVDRAGRPGADAAYDARRRTLTVCLPGVPTATGAEIAFTGVPTLADNDLDERVFTFLDRAQMPMVTKEAAWRAITASDDAGRRISGLQALDLDPVLFGALAEMLLAR